MGWYIVNPIWYDIGYKSEKFYNFTITGGMYYVVDGTLYGTPENPIVQIGARIINSTGTYANNLLDIRPSRNNSIIVGGFRFTKTSSDNYGQMVGYNLLLRSESKLDIWPNVISIESKPIYGKYRIKSAVTSIKYTCIDIPVKFLFDDEKYTNIVFDGSIRKWYRYSKSNYGVNGSIVQYHSWSSARSLWYQGTDYSAMIYNNETFSGTANGPALVNFCNSINSWGDNAGKIIDFGNSPQDAPAFFVDWVNANFEPIYDYSYTVKSSNGENVLTSIKEAPTMTSGIVTVLGNTKTLVFTGANEKKYTLQWDSVTPENKQFVGLSFSPNSSVANFPVGQEMHFNLEGDISLYECYSIYRPPATTFSVNLYKNKAEANRVDKTDYLTSVGTLNGVLREESSITKPIITFESLDIPVFNYVYIPIFNRYYFVNDITSVKYKLWQISLSVDPLMTYKDAIMQCVGFIDRNEHEFNAGIIDKKRAIEQGRTMEVDSVTNELFTGSEGTFSLCALNATAVNVE